MKQTFNQMADGWFDGVAEWAKASPVEAFAVNQIAKLRPSRKNVVKLLHLLQKIYTPMLPQATNFQGNLQHSIGLALLHSHCIFVLDKAFKSEFRFAFGEVTAAESFKTNCRKVSAASELFSMVRQALTT